MNEVTTAVFPVAGMGTRFLPITKSSPKEMLPIIDKPLIQYCVDEAVAAGIKKIIFVTSYTKRAIEDYFDTHYELEARLEARGKFALLDSVRHLVPADVSVCYVRQSSPKGLGDAILCAQPLVGDSSFAVLLADDVIDPRTPCLPQMMQLHQQTSGSVLAVEKVPAADTESYGVVSLTEPDQRVQAIVEKPKPAEAPSNLGVIGRYILTPKVFPLLAAQAPGVGGEVQLTDAISGLLQTETVSAYPLDGVRYDCGSKRGWFEAILAFAERHPELNVILKSKLEALKLQA